MAARSLVYRWTASKQSGTPSKALDGGNAQGGVSASCLQVHHEQTVRGHRARPGSSGGRSVQVHYERTVWKRVVRSGRRRERVCTGEYNRQRTPHQAPPP
jgi:hypothetical protein